MFKTFYGFMLYTKRIKFEISNEANALRSF